MKKIIISAVLASSFLLGATDVSQAKVQIKEVVPMENVSLNQNNTITLTVIGQGVAPESTISPYQALALAKKAAIADAYRMLAEKLYGVRVEGYDIVKNMVIQRSQVKTCVSSMIRHSNIVETKCAKDFCEVEMELKVVGNKWYSELASAYK
jgi:outer membrane protein FlgP